MKFLNIINPIFNRGGKPGSFCCWGMSKININKINHILNGNITTNRPKIIKKLKILHLNKGSKFLSNSNELINDLISREDPDIFSLAE